MTKYEGVSSSRRFIRLLIISSIICIPIKSAIGAIDSPNIADTFSRYNFKIKFDAQNHNLEAIERISFINNTGISLNELHFNIYANKQFSQGEINKVGFYQNYFKVNMFPEGIQGADFKIKSVTNSGRPLAYVIEGPSLTTMNIKLGKSLQPGEGIELEIVFDLKLPHVFGTLGYFQGFGSRNYIR